MKPRLVIGLGNPLVPADAIGWDIAERLARDPRLPDDTEVICGGTDLLRCADQMEGRTHVILVDAIEDTEGELDDRQTNAHHLSAVQAVRLLRMVVPALREVRFTLVGVGQADIGAVLDQVLELLVAHAKACATGQPHRARVTSTFPSRSRRRISTAGLPGNAWVAQPRQGS